MSKLEELLKKHCPDGVEYKILKDIAEIGTGSSNANEKIENGKYPFFVRSQEVFSKNEYEYDETAIIIPGDGNVGKIFHYIEGKYALHQRAYRIHIINKNVIPKYYFYYMTNNFFKYIQKIYFNSSVISIRIPMLNNFSVAIPPIEVQEEIVRILDTFTKYQDLLNRELELRKKQYEYYRDKLLTFGDEVKWKKLNDISEIKSGRNKIKNEVGKYPVYGSTGIIAYSDDYVFNEPHILIARVGINAGYVHIANGLYDVSDNTLIITELSPDICFKYMYYILVNIRLNNYIKGGGIPLITAGEIKNILIPIPPLEEQERIVNILDKFDALCNDITKGLPAEIEMRKKQYEYYRDKLLTFKEKK